jgi:hypothetical protein
VFTARYALSPYIKQIRFVIKGLILLKYFVHCCHNLSYNLTPLLTHKRNLANDTGAAKLTMGVWNFILQGRQI